MARPPSQVIISREFPDGRRWELLEAEYTYIITYKNEPVNIKVTSVMSSSTVYKKLSYTNLGNALRQVKHLNRKFDCEDFALIKIKGSI